MTSISEQKPIEILEGVQPNTDATAYQSLHWVSSQGIRFINGRPRKVGGNSSIDFDDDMTISGKARSIFSKLVGTSLRFLIGTNTRLYTVVGTALTNISPLSTATTSIPNALDTHRATLSNNPIATTSGSMNLTITDSEYNLLAAGDTITLSGSSSLNGITAAAINASHIVRDIGSGNFTITVSSAANATGSGGGAAVIRSSGLITVDSSSHSLINGDRIKINNASALGGIAAGAINIEHPIRNKTTNTFDIFVTGTATASVTNGGSTAATLQKQINSGTADESFGQGYGMGRYGTGLYGVSKISSSGRVLPRIWYFDKFGDNIIMTAGNQTGVYEWAGNTTTAPTKITNAPSAVNYAFVTNGIIVTLGAGGTENRIYGCDQNNKTVWTGSSTNQVFDDTIEGAGRFLTHASALGTNLIFTDNEVYTLRYIGVPFIFEVKRLEGAFGIISSMARVSVGNIIYWMGYDNFYMWRGGDIEVIPSNSGPISTIWKYVYNDLNFSQKSKCFAWYNQKFNEIWFHYPSSSSNETDRVARLSLTTYSWCPDTMNRIAAEYPNMSTRNPRLVDSSGILYQHETGTDNDGSALSFSIKSPRRYSGSDKALIAALIPDSIQNGDISVSLDTYEFAQSTSTLGTQSMTIGQTTGRIPAASVGRFWDWEISGAVIGQNFIMGDWMDEIQRSGR